MASTAQSSSYKEACNELSTLKRVSHRLAMTDGGAPLQKVLSLLLPRLLLRIGSNHVKKTNISNSNSNSNMDVDGSGSGSGSGSVHVSVDVVVAVYDGIHAKLVEMMSHIIKRVRADDTVLLPCKDLLNIINNGNSDKDDEDEDEDKNMKKDINPFTMNLTLTFLTIGIPRCPIEQLEPILPALLIVMTNLTDRAMITSSASASNSRSTSTSTLTSMKQKSQNSQAFQVAHLVLRAVERIVVGHREQKSKSKLVTRTVDTKKSSNQSMDHHHHKTNPKKKSRVNERGNDGGNANDIGNDNNSKGKDAAPTGTPAPTPMEQVRTLCSHPKHEHDAVSATLYDLFLDVLLYSNTARTGARASNASGNASSSTSSIPPPGLSQFGNERLKSGSSTSSESGGWAMEYSYGDRLKELKLALLEFIAPCRRFDLFHVSVVTCSVSGSDNDNMNGSDNIGGSSGSSSSNSSALSTARAVALMVAAQGDANLDVAEKAGSYLKAHLDSLRNVNVKNENSGTNSNSSGVNGSTNRSGAVSELLGDPIALICELLGHVLGGVIATSAIQKIKLGLGIRTGLGRDYAAAVLRGNSNDADANEHEHDNDNDNETMVAMDPNITALASTKRRMVSQKHATNSMVFITTRAIDDLPSIFMPMSPFSDATNNNNNNNNNDNNITSAQGLDLGLGFDGCAETAAIVGTLVIMATKKYAGSAHSLSGLSVTSSVGNPSVASVKLLNSVCVRLAVLFDAMTVTAATTTNTTMTMTMLDMGREVCSKKWIRSIHDILARAFLNGCNIVSMASSSHSGDVTGSIGIEARDAAYGIICTICRSNVASSGGGIVFHCSESLALEDNDNGQGKSLSTKTAKTLFGCVSNEAETLKPRAVAALDSLLSAYCKLFEHSQTSDQSKHENVKMDDQPLNPWAMEVDTDVTKGVALELRFEGLTKSLLPLLWNALQSKSPKASRHAAAQWTNSLLKSLDLNASCHMLCFIAGDKDETSARLATNGLCISHQIGEEVTTLTKDGRDIPVPEFHDFINSVYTEEVTMTSWRPTFHNFSPTGQGASLRFGLICLLSDLYGGDDGATKTYLNYITETLQSYDSSKQSLGRIQLLDEASICYAGLLKTSHFARQSVVNGNHCFSISQLAELALSAPSSKARRYLATAYLHLLNDASIWSSGGQFQLSKWLSESYISSIVESCEAALKEMTLPSIVIAKVHGAAYVGSACVQALRNCFASESSGTLLHVLLDRASTIIQLLGRGTLHKEEVVGNACAGALSIAFSYDSDDAPELCGILRHNTSSALKFISTSLRRYGNGDHLNPQRATSIARAAGTTLAATTVHTQQPTDGKSSIKIDADDIGKRRLDCVEALFFLLGSMANRKDPELALVVGEALAEYADAYSPEGCQWSYPKIDKPVTFDQEYANDLPPHDQVLYVVLQKELLSTNPHKKTAASPVLLAFVGRAAKKVHQKRNVLKSREFIKAICRNLSAIQQAFLVLLADPKSKQIGRESCQLGLAACYAISVVASSTDDLDKNIVTSNALNESLLKAFGQTYNHGGSALMESRAQHEERVGAAGAAMMERFGTETEVGGAAGLSEAALGAFREMASASVVLGRPDVLYSLMLLSVSLPTWSSTQYNAATLLGETVDASGNIEEIRLALRPHLVKLIPRLLRACNDPNKQTREQMGKLWVGLTGGGPEARALISKNLISTIDTLIDGATNKLWRSRVGSCSALAEIIVGRSWEDLGGGGPIDDCNDTISAPAGAASRLLRLYRVTIRSLDDVRLTVREAGDMLSRSVRSLTARLCDPTIDSNGDGMYSGKSAILEKIQTSSAASATVLPWLVKIGLNQSCAEASGFSVSCLLNVVEVARSETLRPVLPSLIGSILMAMSGLEPAALNYLQERAAGHDSNSSRTGDDGYNRLERIRLQMAQSGPLAGALSKCIDMLKSADVDCQQSVIPELDSALRRGAGFATRAAAADAVSSLCSVSPLAFKFPGNSSANPTVRLLRALYYASERERGAGAKDKMSHALGTLAALAPGSSVRSLAVRLCQRYNSAVGGTHDDPAARRAIAAALRAIAVRASNQFADGGSKNVWIKYVLPLAFIAKKDKDVGQFFQEVWDEGGQASQLGNSNASFSTQLQETILPYLTKALIQALDDVSWSRRVLACSALTELADTNILSPAPRALDEDKLSVTNEALMLRSKIRSRSSAEILAACLKLIVSTRIWVGKAELLKTISKIGGNWIRHGSNDEKSARIFGYMKSKDTMSRCPWMPILLQESTNDLFVMDGWFLTTRNDDREEEGVDNMQIDQVDVKNDNTDEDDSEIDFDKGDHLLKTDYDGMDMVVELTTNESEEITSISSYGLCRLLFEQGIPTNIEVLTKADHLLYRASAIESLADIIDCLSADKNSQHLKALYSLIAPRILRLIQDPKVDGQDIPPLIIAKCFRCYASIIFEGIGNDPSIDLREITNLLLINCGQKQSAWTVKEAAAATAAKLIVTADHSSIKKMATIDVLIECTSSCLKDRKFWKVRLSGLKIILAYCSRTNSHTSVGMGSKLDKKSEIEKEGQLLLEAILPYKERFATIARSCMTDSEAKVTAVAADVMAAMSWWP